MIHLRLRTSKDIPITTNVAITNSAMNMSERRASKWFIISIVEIKIPTNVKRTPTIPMIHPESLIILSFIPLLSLSLCTEICRLGPYQITGTPINNNSKDKVGITDREKIQVFLCALKQTLPKKTTGSDGHLGHPNLIISLKR